LTVILGYAYSEPGPLDACAPAGGRTSFAVATAERTCMPPDTTPAPPGFKKIDLHIHTHFSACYIDHMKPEAKRQTRPEEILEAALTAGLDGMAVTDHNGVEMVQALRELAAGTSLTILPGTELSTRGGHLLGIFAQDANLDTIRELLLAIGFPREQWGDGFKRTDVWMDRVIEEIAARGGVAIPAHVDREPRGFLASDERPSDKLRIYTHPDLAALEITDPRKRERWNNGTDIRYKQPRACVQSSDAHAPEEIGRRPVFMRMEQVSLDGVRTALADYRNSVVFPSDVAAAD
jgi:predicted metal-dependent phosphoesterase TrpH